MKELTMILKHDSRVADAEKESMPPTEPWVIGFIDTESDQILADPYVDRGDYLKVGEALTALFFLIAVTALGRKKPLAAQDLLHRERAEELIKEKLYNVAIRTKSPKWLYEIFGENPKNRYLVARNLDVRFADCADDGERIEIIIENKETRRKLSEEEIQVFCEKLLLPKQTSRLHKVVATLDFIRKNGTSFLVTNWGHQHHIEWHDSFWLKLESNCPDFFCVFWVDALARVYELHPNINSDLGTMHYTTSFTRSEDEGSSTLSAPFKNTISIDTHRGVENCIFFTSNRRFERENVDEMKRRLKTLMKNDVYCRSDNVFDYFEKQLDAEMRPPLEDGIVEMELEATPSLTEWREKIISQMHGFAAKIHFLQLAHLPRKV